MTNESNGTTHNISNIYRSSAAVCDLLPDTNLHRLSDHQFLKKRMCHEASYLYKYYLDWQRDDLKVMKNNILTAGEIADNIACFCNH